MALTQTAGNRTLSSSEQNLFASQTTLQHYATHIFLNLMAVGDIVEIKVYVKDQQGAVERVYETDIYFGVQDDPAIFVPFLPTNSYRVTAKRTAGSVASLNWARLDLA